MKGINSTAIIPARYNSTRLPGKPLIDLAGKTLIQRVYEQVKRSRLLTRVIVATDDSRIEQAVSGFGGDCLMTSTEHETGTDRIAEVARFIDSDIIVNVQGDEPFISPDVIDAAIEPLLVDHELQMSTTCEPLADPQDLLNPNVVKVVMDAQKYALYFSRAPIPFPRDVYLSTGIEAVSVQSGYRHTGLYVYRRDFLLEYASWPRSPLEQIESLEQLRALEHGIKVKVVECKGNSLSIDTPQDLQKALERLSTGD